MRERTPTFDEILYEKPADQVVLITLNRPEARNVHFSAGQDLVDRGCLRASLTAAPAAR